MMLELDLKFIKRKSYALFHLSMSKHVGGKCRKLCISSILSSKRDITPTTKAQKTAHNKPVMKILNKQLSKHAQVTKVQYAQVHKTSTVLVYNSRNGHQMTTLILDLMFMKRKLCTKFQRKLCISNILTAKRGIAHIKIDANTLTWSEVHNRKVIYKISAQYVKACRKEVRKTVFQIFWVPKGTELIQKLTTLKLDLRFIKRKSHTKFQLIKSKHVEESILCSKRGITPTTSIWVMLKPHLP